MIDSLPCCLPSTWTVIGPWTQLTSQCAKQIYSLTLNIDFNVIQAMNVLVTITIAQQRAPDKQLFRSW